MSGETEKSVSGWTVDTLKEHFGDLLGGQKEYFERRLLDQNAAMEKAFAAAEKAVATAETHAAEWRTNANEWRQAMMDREVKFATRAEVDGEMRGQAARLDILEKSKEAAAGERRGQQGAIAGGRAWLATLATLLTILGIVVGFVATHLLNK